jgi:arylformamidase
LVVDVSDLVDDYTILTREMFEAAAKKAPPIEKGDAVIVHYHWHRFNWEGETPDEVRYFCKCPGPSLDLTDYFIEKELRWVGTDAPSLEHPFWTAIRGYRPDLVREMEEKFGRSIEEMLPERYFLQCHRRMLARNMMHIDNVGGDIDQVLNQKLTIGAFPWKFQRGDASICRLVAFVDD